MQRHELARLDAHVTAARERVRVDALLLADLRPVLRADPLEADAPVVRRVQQMKRHVVRLHGRKELYGNVHEPEADGNRPDEVAATYPFHPRLKNLIALFKNNEKFKQTRGLMELVSRLLKSVWERPTNDVFLIGAQHFDLAITDVREKLIEISEMNEVVSRDLWDVNQAAHAQVIDLQRSSDAATQAGTLLLVSSLNTTMSQVRGLTREELATCLVAPNRKASEFLEAFELLAKDAWYLHGAPADGRSWFAKSENLTKMLAGYAKEAPPNKVEELQRDRLKAMFKPSRRTVYDEVLPLPVISEVANHVRKALVLLVVPPESKLPPESIQKLVDGLAEKNNLCVLTGEKTAMASLDEAARKLFAAARAATQIGDGHAQKKELQTRTEQFEQEFLATALALFDKVLFPRTQGNKTLLASKAVNNDRDQQKPYNGEAQLEKTLAADPIKLILDIEGQYDTLRTRAEDLLFPQAQPVAPWKDVVERASHQAGFPWLPPKGLETLRSMAVQRGHWEQLDGDQVTHKPKKKTTSAQVAREHGPSDDGTVRLRVNTQHGGPAPRIHYAVSGAVSIASPTLTEPTLETNALRVAFLVVDPSNTFETGEPVVWKNELVIRNELVEEAGARRVKLLVGPKANLRYSLDGTDARHGQPYVDPIPLGDAAAKVWVFAEAEDLESRAEFSFPAKNATSVIVDPGKPAKLVAKGPPKRLDSRERTFEGFQEAKTRGIRFQDASLTIGANASAAMLTFPDLEVDADYLEKVLVAALTAFPDGVPVTLAFKKALAPSGHALEQFLQKLSVTAVPGEVFQ